MNLNFRNYDETKYVPRFQEGGQMPAEAPVEEAPIEGAPAPEEQGGDPMQQLLQVAAQALQAQDCQAAMAVCDALLQLAQGGAPAEEAPVEAPVYKMGGKLSRRIKK